MKESRKDKKDARSFEEALHRLEEIVESLEQGQLPLEEAIRTFEEGTQLRRICEGRLREAERKIEMLLKDEDGHLTTSPIDEGEAPGGEGADP